MINTCFVPNCNSGYKSCKEKCILFKAPKNDARKKSGPKQFLEATEFLEKMIMSAKSTSAAFLLKD